MQLIPLTGTITMPFGMSPLDKMMQLIPLTGTITAEKQADPEIPPMQLIPLTGTITFRRGSGGRAGRRVMQLIPLTGTITCLAQPKLNNHDDTTHTPHGDDNR